MALAMTVVDHWLDGKRLHVIGTLTPSGNYATGGDAVPFNDPLIKTGQAPIWLVAKSLSFAYDFVGVCPALGTAPPSAKLAIVTRSTGVELAAGAYPGGFNVIQFHAIFPRG